MPSDKLSRGEIDLVLRRAAEIEQGRARAEQAADEGGAITVGELVRLGEEAGLGSDVVVQALGELRRGSLVPPPDEGTLARTLGPGRLVVTREIPGPADPVRRALDRFMREQLMTVRRHHGDRVEWERAQGLWPGLARSLDFARRYALGAASSVETVVVEGEGPRTQVAFNVDLSELRRHRLWRMAMRAAAAFALVGVGGAFLFPGLGPADVAALLAGGGLAGGLVALERRRYHEVRERVALAPERFLDLLLQRRKRALERGLTAAEDPA